MTLPNSNARYLHEGYHLLLPPPYAEDCIRDDLLSYGHLNFQDFLDKEPQDSDGFQRAAEELFRVILSTAHPIV
ncbi:MAG: hypothetical protein HONDAALG_02095 [Gammaproteobacteria bacterium]|nr:hypothetical protein [Gammaproteobacteria bacterium]